jgi:CHASE2 domain-containing sensor protein
MNTATILTDKLHHFIYELRQAGYNIGTTQFMQAQNLILSLAQQGQLPPMAQLKTLLGPILCHSRQEQQEFGERFDNWLQTIEASQQIRKSYENISQTKVTETKRSKPLISKKWGFAILLFFIIVGGIFSYYQFITPSPTTSPEEATQKTEQPIEPSGEKTELADTAVDSTKSLPDSSEEAIELPKEIIEDSQDEKRLSDWILWIVWSILGAIILLFLLGKIASRYLAPLHLARKYTTALPTLLKKLPVKQFEKQIFQPQSIALSRTAQQLRKHVAIESNDLDMVATVKETIQAAGLFTPVYGTRLQRPEYLVLIDRATFQDHQTGLINVLMNQLEADEVLIERYYFERDLRRCYPEQEALPPLTLTELAERYPEHRLLIFSDGEGLIHPVTGELVRWIEQLMVWPSRAILTLEAPEQWGYQEELFTKANFLVLPANEIGLNHLVEQFNVETQQPFPDMQRETPFDFPELIRNYPRRWLEDYAPDSDELVELLTQVRLFLGKDGYYWFSACAVYPEIHWELTLHLGDSLKNDNHQPLLTEANFAKLARLPWFRHSYMPNWLRERLVKDLLISKKDKTIRMAIERFLQPKPGEESTKTQVEVAFGQPKDEQGSSVTERVFAMFMADKHELSAIALNLEYLKLLVSSHLLPWFKQIMVKLSLSSKSFIFILPVVLLSILTLGLFELYQFVQRLPKFSMPDAPFSFFLITLIGLVMIFSWLIDNLRRLILRRNPYLDCPSPKLCTFFSKVFIGLAVWLIFIPLLDYPSMMYVEDTTLDFAMQAKQNEIPPAKEKQIPPFVFLDIDNQTHQLWNSPLFTPRNKVKELIEVAVQGKARLIVVDIDLSRKTPFEGLRLDRRHRNLQLHPYDQELYDYIADYKTYCETKLTCPPILLRRVFQPLPNVFQSDHEPIRKSRISFLETAVANSTPDVQWASPLFLRSYYDSVIRRWKLWQPVCTNGNPEVIPSFQLLAAAIVRHGSPQKAKESIDNAFAEFKPNHCDDAHLPQETSSQPIKIAEGFTVSEGSQGIRQRIMYNMSWQPPQNTAEKFTLRYFLLDYDKETQEREVILTVFSAQPFLDATKEDIARAGVLKDKIVVIGGSYDDGGDIHPTPLEAMPGALIIINAIHSLLQYGELQRLSGWTEFGWMIAMIVIVSLFLTYFPQFWVTIVSGLLVISLIPMAVLWLGEGIWINFAFPLLAIHIYHIAENYQRMRRELNKSPEQIRQEESLIKSLRQESPEQLVEDMEQLFKEQNRLMQKISKILMKDE